MQYTSIPVNLKILKLFIKELSNIAEGENGNGVEERPNTSSSDNADDGWESDEDEDGEWENDTENSDTGPTSTIDRQQDLLKGIDTKVAIICFLRRTDDRTTSLTFWERLLHPGLHGN